MGTIEILRKNVGDLENQSEVDLGGLRVGQESHVESERSTSTSNRTGHPKSLLPRQEKMEGTL